MTIDQLICQLEYAAPIVGRDVEVFVDTRLKFFVREEGIINNSGYALVVMPSPALTQTQDPKWHTVAYLGGLN